MNEQSSPDDRDDAVGRVAVVGMSGRFPGADSVDRLWDLIASGQEGISRFTPRELRAGGVPEALRDAPGYVPAKGVLDDVEGFDSRLFGYSGMEASLIDPQQRIFLECAWAAMEDAGCDPQRVAGPVAVYAGSLLSTYLIRNLLPRTDLQVAYGVPMLFQGNQPDQLAPRVAYKLDLRGPAVTVQTACSTSLVAVHLAAQSLLSHECDLALAGGVTVTVPHRAGYLPVEGGIESADGRCAPFSADADGTVFGNGAGVVVLKRLEDALADGDRVHAVILGSAVNNDGADKAGYTAPGAAGQTAVIAEALAMAGVAPGSIGYVEAHGTGTPIGDPIEVAALKAAHAAAAHDDEPGPEAPCALGSVKSNIGHLDAAAGVTGLIKTVLTLRHGRIPATLHAERTHPELGLDGSRFFVPDRLVDWPVADGPRRAAVSAFGIGGTNAHVILEQAPATPPSAPRQDDAEPLLLPLSAATATALDTLVARLADDLAAHPERPLADVARTLHAGRRRLAHRRVVVARDTAEAIAALRDGGSGHCAGGRADQDEAPVAFLLPGQGTQFPGMARALHTGEPVFRRALDECADLLAPQLGRDLREVMWEATAEELAHTRLTQPAVFSVGYALARLWEHRGIVPAALLGHSLGEYTAACLAGVFTLPDALSLVAARGRLMEETEPGAMLSVALDADGAALAAEEFGIDVAAVNAPAASVLSGPPEAVDRAQQALAARGLRVRRLPGGHAFHSRLCRSAAERFTALLDAVPAQPPRIPFLSNLTGDWITPEQATDPAYWTRQMCDPVRFHAALRRLADHDPRTILLETGPGSVLTDLAAADREIGLRAARPPLPSHRAQGAPEPGTALLTLGSLWTLGAAGTDHVTEPTGGRVTTLPAYPFEHHRHWIEPHDGPAQPPVATTPVAPAADAVLHARVAWRPVDPAADEDPFGGRRHTWLVFLDPQEHAQPLADLIASRGQIATCVLPGTAYRRVRRGVYEIDPADPGHYTRLLSDLRALVRTPTAIAYCWGHARPQSPDGAADHGDGAYAGLIRLARALSAEKVVHDVRIGVLTAGAFAVRPGESADPGGALLSGPVMVLPQENRNLTCAQIDLDADAAGRPMAEDEATTVVRALLGDDGPLLALRDARVLERRLRSQPPPPAPAEPGLLTSKGTYVITGGLGGIGRTLAAHLARACAARLVLVGRSPAPDPDHTDADLARFLGELTDAGADVLIEQADVTDADALAGALDRARARFGPIDGVIHAAGLPGGGAVDQRAESDMSAVLAPKTAGVRNLLAALRPGEADFLLLCSSLASVVPTYGQADYTAANAYLDAVAAAENARGARFTLSVNWDMWSGVGMAADAVVPADLRDLQRAMLDGALTPAAGADAFAALLGGDPGQAVVARATAELTDDGLLLVTARPPAPASSRSTPRPDLTTPYTAPRTDTEEVLAEIYAEMLGLDTVGVLDDFLDLGGHSLLAAQMVARLRTEFGVDVPARVFFEGGRVADVAVAVEDGIISELESHE